MALRDFGGTVVHASDFYRAAAFTDKRVLVVGWGASGVEIAADLARKAACKQVPP